MAKKASKKVVKKTVAEPATPCTTEDPCHGRGILALIIIALVWWKPAVMWSQITITVAAAIILFSEHPNCCK